MKATVTFFPNANSPSLVDGPSAIISPIFTLSPTLTKGLWFIQVFWLDLLNFCKV